jgi:hypothetical protein
MIAADVVRAFWTAIGAGHRPGLRALLAGDLAAARVR